MDNVGRINYPMGAMRRSDLIVASNSAQDNQLDKITPDHCTHWEAIEVHKGQVERASDLIKQVIPTITGSSAPHVPILVSWFTKSL